MSDTDSWTPSPLRVELGEDEIHVWRADLHREEDRLREFEAILASDEKARAARFMFQRDRNAFVATRGILREILGKYLSRSPSTIEFEYGPQGKPSLRGLVDSKLQFNVSQSHSVALLAFTIERNLGVDLEFIRPHLMGEEIAKLYFSPQELRELRTVPASLQAESFFLCWTRKEAYIKARGEGLHIPLDSFHVSLTPGQPERLESTDSRRWTMRTLRPGPGFVAALVGEGSDWHLCCLDWEPLDD